MIIVLNEWVFHDLLGENGQDAQRQTAEFLNLFYASADTLVLPDDLRWKGKAYELLRLSDASLRITCQQFHTVMRNSDRAIDARSVPSKDMPSGLSVHEDDRYLVVAYLSTNADSLVTTDQTLYEALTDSDVVSCQLRSKFLANYRT